jgi:hypothetical protein
MEDGAFEKVFCRVGRKSCWISSFRRANKYKPMSTVQEISAAIEQLDIHDQIRLLHDLPAHLKIQPDDVAWLKAAEPAFEFWNNPDDAVYDEL